MVESTELPRVFLHLVLPQVFFFSVATVEQLFSVLPRLSIFLNVTTVLHRCFFHIVLPQLERFLPVLATVENIYHSVATVGIFGVATV